MYEKTMPAGYCRIPEAAAEDSHFAEVVAGILYNFFSGPDQIR